MDSSAGFCEVYNVLLEHSFRYFGPDSEITKQINENWNPTIRPDENTLVQLVDKRSRERNDSHLNFLYVMNYYIFDSFHQKLKQEIINPTSKHIDPEQLQFRFDEEELRKVMGNIGFLLLKEPSLLNSETYDYMDLYFQIKKLWSIIITNRYLNDVKFEVSDIKNKIKKSFAIVQLMKIEKAKLKIESFLVSFDEIYKDRHTVKKHIEEFFDEFCTRYFFYINVGIGHFIKDFLKIIEQKFTSIDLIKKHLITLRPTDQFHRTLIDYLIENEAKDPLMSESSMQEFINLINAKQQELFPASPTNNTNLFDQENDDQELTNSFYISQSITDSQLLNQAYNRNNPSPEKQNIASTDHQLQNDSLANVQTPAQQETQSPNRSVRTAGSTNQITTSNQVQTSQNTSHNALDESLVDLVRISHDNTIVSSTPNENETQDKQPSIPPLVVMEIVQEFTESQSSPTTINKETIITVTNRVSDLTNHSQSLIELDRLNVDTSSSSLNRTIVLDTASGEDFTHNSRTSRGAVSSDSDDHGDLEAIKHMESRNRKNAAALSSNLSVSHDYHMFPPPPPRAVTLSGKRKLIASNSKVTSTTNRTKSPSIKNVTSRPSNRNELRKKTSDQDTEDEESSSQTNIPQQTGRRKRKTSTHSSDVDESTSSQNSFPIAKRKTVPISRKRLLSETSDSSDQESQVTDKLKLINLDQQKYDRIIAFQPTILLRPVGKYRLDEKLIKLYD